MIAGRITVDSGFVRGNGSFAVMILNMRTSETQVAFSNRLGYYEFNDLTVGDTYVVTVRGKGFSFTPQAFTLFEDSSLDMLGMPVVRSSSKQSGIR
jgi:accessory colonization factor AcfC